MDPAEFTATSLSKSSSMKRAPSDRMWLGKKRGTASGRDELRNTELLHQHVEFGVASSCQWIRSVTAIRNTRSSNPFVSVVVEQGEFRICGACRLTLFHL